jgi:hypothetical protein
MILEVLADTWKINNRLDANLLELLLVTDTTSLKDQWR